MRFSELGFDFSNLNTVSIRRKSFLTTYILLIVSITFIIIFLVFGILYLFEVPMEMNGVMVPYTDPSYQEFFRVFLLAFGGVSIALLLPAFLTLFIAPKLVLVKDQDPELNPFFYIFDSRKKREIYLTDHVAWIYQTKYNQVHKEVNPNELKAIREKFIFWEGLDAIEDYKLIPKAKKTVLKYKESTQMKFVTKMIRFTFSNEINVVPNRISKLVNVRAGGNYRTQEAYTYLVEDVNRQPHFEIHPEIKRALSKDI